MRPTYTEQYDKLTVAYLQGKLKPLQPQSCFVGVLLNGNAEWRLNRVTCPDTHTDHILDPEAMDPVYGLYTSHELICLEDHFVEKCYVAGKLSDGRDCFHVTEYSLFDALNSTIDLLRSIHAVREVTLQVA